MSASVQNVQIQLDAPVPAGEAPFLSEEHELVEPIAGLIRAAMFGVHATKLQEGAQQALRWSEDRLQAALDATGVGIVDWDLRAERATLTETARVIMGLPEGQLEATAADIRGCIHPDDYERMRANFHLERLFGRARSHEYRVKHPDGTVRWVSSRGRMTMDDHGDVVRRLSIMMDVTERRVLQEQLQHAQRLEAMGQLAGGMAHDFNNLLTVIGAAAEFIADAAAQGGPMHADAEEVLKAVRSGKALTRQLLTFSRRQVVRHERVDLNAVVRSCDALVKRLITANVSLHQECAANPVVVEIDPHQLEQVLINLVINARDAMPSGGMLTIRADTAVRHDDPTYPGSMSAR